MDRHALVVYDTRYGNTLHVAEALTRGLRQTPGIVASCHNQDEVHADLLEEADLIVIGGPTEYLSASHHIREFFARVSGFDLRGKLGFAFDTHASTPLSGSASRLIEKDLRRLGVILLEPRHTVFTRRVRGGGSGEQGGTIEIAPEAIAEFEMIGRHLGTELLETLDRRPKDDSDAP